MDKVSSMTTDTQTLRDGPVLITWGDGSTGFGRVISRGEQKMVLYHDDDYIEPVNEFVATGATLTPLVALAQPIGEAIVEALMLAKFDAERLGYPDKAAWYQAALDVVNVEPTP